MIDNKISSSDSHNLINNGNSQQNVQSSPTNEGIDIQQIDIQENEPIPHVETLERLQRRSLINNIVASCKNRGVLNSEFYRKYREQIQRGQTENEYLKIYPSNRDRNNPLISESKDNLEARKKLIISDSVESRVRKLFEFQSQLPPSIADHEYIEAYKDQIIHAMEELSQMPPMNKQACEDFIVKWTGKFQDTINAFFIKLKIPKPIFDIILIGPPADSDDIGEFDAEAWTIKIYVEDIFKNPQGMRIQQLSYFDLILFDETSGLLKTPEDLSHFAKKFLDLATTLIHESLHVEQGFRVACLGEYARLALETEKSSLEKQIVQLGSEIFIRNTVPAEGQGYVNAYAEIKSTQDKIDELEKQIFYLEKKTAVLKELADLSSTQAQSDKYKNEYKTTFQELITAKNKKILYENKLPQLRSDVTDLGSKVLIPSDPNQLQSRLEAYFKACFEREDVISTINVIKNATSGTDQKILKIVKNFVNQANIKDYFSKNDVTLLMGEILYNNNDNYAVYADSIIEVPAYELEAKIHKKVIELLKRRNLFPSVTSPQMGSLHEVPSNLRKINLEHIGKLSLATLALREREYAALTTLQKNFFLIHELGQKETAVGDKRRLNQVSSPKYIQFTEMLAKIGEQFVSSIPPYDPNEAALRGHKPGYLEKNEGYFSLREILNKLESLSGNGEFALLTPHLDVMLVGKKILGGDIEEFYFYDPQGDITFESKDSDNFYEKLITHFDRDRRLNYGIHQRGAGIETSEFRLVSLDTTSLEKTHLLHVPCTADQFVQSSTLQRTFLPPAGQYGIGDGQCGAKGMLGLVSLAEGREEGLKGYLETLRKIYSSQEPDVKILGTVLGSINNYINEEYGLNLGDLKYSLDDIIEKIRGSNKKHFKLGTQKHAMGLSVEELSGGQLVYRLLDFDGSESGEVTIIKSYNLEEFKIQLKNYFSPYRLSLYGVDSEDIKFELKEMNPTFLREIPIWIPDGKNPDKGYYIISGQIAAAKPETIERILRDAKENSRKVEEILDAVEENKKNYTFSIELVEQLDGAIKEVRASNPGLTGDHIPQLGDTKKERDGTYTLAFYHMKNASITYIKSLNPIFYKVKEYLNHSIHEVKNHINQLRSKYDRNLTGVSTGFAVLYLMDLLKGKKEEHISEELKIALTAHLYVSLAGSMHGVVEDGVSFKRMVEGIRNKNSGGLKAPSQFMKYFGRAGHFLNLGSIGLDSYFLSQTKDKEEKQILSIQLGFTMASTAVSFISGPVGLAMGGLGWLVTDVLTKKLSNNRELRKPGEYLAKVDKAYEKGYEYSRDNHLLEFSEGAVIRKLDFTKAENQIEFGSQYLYTAPRSANEDDGKKENAISLRNALGKKSAHTIDQQALRAPIISLPKYPEAYIHWKKVNFTTSAQGQGSLIDELAPDKKEGPGYSDGISARITKYSEEHSKNGNIFVDENVSWSLYNLHSDTATKSFIKELTPLAERTDVEVILPKEDKILVIPALVDTPKEHSESDAPNAKYMGVMNYKIKGNGGQYSVVLNTGGTLELSTLKPGTQWLLDARNVPAEDCRSSHTHSPEDPFCEFTSDDISVESGKIRMGDVEIKFDETTVQNSQLFITASDAILEIDLKNNKISRKLITDTYHASVTDNSQGTDNYLKTFETFFQAGTPAHLSKEYIPIRKYRHNYATGSSPYNSQFQYDGNAYYSVENKRMLFTSQAHALELQRNTGLDARIFQEGKWGAAVGEDVYFYHSHSPYPVEGKTVSFIWRVDALSGKIQEVYTLPISPDHKDEIRMWQENGKVFFSKKGTSPHSQSTFALDKDKSIELVSHQEPVEDITNIRLADTYAKASSDQIFHYKMQGGQWSTPTNKEIPHAGLVSIYGTDKRGNTYCYWVKSESGALMRRIIVPHLPEDIKASSAKQLSLCHTIEEENKYFFYDSIGKALYLQSGVGTLTPSASIIKASKINAQIEDVYKIGVNLFVLQEDGLIYQVDKNGKMTLESVSEKWLQAQGKNWLQQLKTLSITDGKALSLHGLLGLDKMPLSAWYYQGQLLFAPYLIGNNLQLIHTEKNFAYFFDSKKGKLYKQPIVNENLIQTAFGDGYALFSNHSIPAAQDLFPQAKFKAAWKEGGLIHLMTPEGGILEMGSLEQPILIALNKSWLTHTGNKSSTIRELIQQWPSASPLLPIESDNPQASNWYHIDEHRFLSFPIPLTDQPQYVGFTRSEEQWGLAIYYIQTNKGLKSFSFSYNLEGNQLVSNLREQKKLASLEAYRIEDTLLLKGSPGNDILKPLIIQNVKNMVFYGGSGEDTYIIQKEDREKIKHFVINNFDKEKSKNKLHLELKEYYNTKLTRKGNNLLIADQKGTVEIENVFGTNKEDYSHLELQLTFENSPSIKKIYQVSDLLQKMKENILVDPSKISSSPTHLIFNLSSLQN